jgi:hypothetical protein
VLAYLGGLLVYFVGRRRPAGEASELTTRNAGGAQRDGEETHRIGLQIRQMQMPSLAFPPPHAVGPARRRRERVGSWWCGGVCV